MTEFQDSVARGPARAVGSGDDVSLPALRSGVVYLVDDRSQLFTYNPLTRDIVYVGSMSQELFDIAISPTGAFFGLTSTTLYSVNPDTGALSSVASLQRSANSFVFDVAGRALTQGSLNSNLVELNIVTGSGTILGNAGHSRGAEGDLAFYDGRLFVTNSGRRIDEINPTNGALVRSTETTVDNLFGLVSFEGRILAFAGRNVYEFNPAAQTLTLLHTLLATVSGRTIGSMNGAAAFDFGQTGRAILGDDGNNVISGTALDDVLQGGAGADSLSGLAGNDRLLGSDGVDVLVGGAGNDALNGGAGVDTAEYAGVWRQYVASSASVSGNGEGTDTLVAVENARFVDGVLTFDPSSAYAQVMRLYSATLNRAPDQGGLEANVAALGQLGLQGLANTFVASAEFQARFGALNNQQFVEQLYLFALGRAGDPGGVAVWVNALNAGASRGQIVIGFSESAENIGRTAGTLNAGLWIPDAQALVIARLYDATFDRLPDVGGLASWTAALKAGTSALDIAAAFSTSAEFQARYGALSNQQYVEQLYRFCLNREGDAAGVAHWVSVLNGGASRASLLLSFSESAEHVALTAPLWSGGIRVLGLVGASDETAKLADEAQVLPDLSGETLGLEAGVYDPSDLGLTVIDKAEDAFVLPALPDGQALATPLVREGAEAVALLVDIAPPSPDVSASLLVDLIEWNPHIAGADANLDGHWLT